MANVADLITRTSTPDQGKEPRSAARKISESAPIRSPRPGRGRRPSGWTTTEAVGVVEKERDDTIGRLKDPKARPSTKTVGETLEQHCEIEFNQLRASAFPNSYFEKDNDVRSGPDFTRASSFSELFRFWSLQVDVTNGPNEVM